MGYTHYYSNKRAFTDSEWKQFTEQVKNLLETTEIPVAGPLGHYSTCPVYTDEHIFFNGLEEDSHETAAMRKEAMEFDFCKTAMKPYDSLVVKMYQIAKDILGDGIELDSDGGQEVFR